MHPALKIIALIGLAITVQFIQPWALLVMGILVSMTTMLLFPALFWRMLTRSRWLLLTLLLIFSFTTPGEYVRHWPFGIAPTYEGTTMGLLQGGRLIIMLAGLALLLGSTGREALMAGIYFLIQPLKIFGLSPQRFTARLWLTLHYVEQAPKRQHRTQWAMLDEVALDNHEAPSQTLALTIPALNRIDGLVLCAVAVVLIVWLT